ncbi:MAG: DUF1572 domain-containing protein [Phycisphaerae bacterium]
MNLPAQIAQHFRAVHFGGNWTAVNLKDQLTGVSWQNAAMNLDSCHSIATLTYHVNYFVAAVLQVLRGEPLTAHDKFSFDCPPIRSEGEWNALREKLFANAKDAAMLIEQLPESTLWETFVEEKYGTYYRNLHGTIEHSHYHLGQITLTKKRLDARTQPADPQDQPEAAQAEPQNDVDHRDR